jgi:hypothetical protein
MPVDDAIYIVRLYMEMKDREKAQRRALGQQSEEQMPRTSATDQTD